MANSPIPLSNTQPIVSIICLCYNHARFLEDSLQSVVGQTYPNLELIIVDDASTDASVELIEAFLAQHTAVQFVRLPTNGGNCHAFNQGLALAKGKYIIDLAADDLLLPGRVSRQVAAFEALGEHYAVVYTNALRVDESSQEMGVFYENDQTRARLPQGDVYTAVLKKFFICVPTMMIRKQVLDELGGYDESLSYEDFDFWIRSSRSYHYHYLDEVLTVRREVGTSHSRQLLWRKDDYSTLKICQKALLLNRTEAENRALAHRVRYHLRQAFLTEDFALVVPYVELLRKLAPIDSVTQLVIVAARMKLRVAKYYRLYLKKKYSFS
jgi:glycosyltransferase involved in cell wall biosynthesis